MEVGDILLCSFWFGAALFCSSFVVFLLKVVSYSVRDLAVVREIMKM